LGKSAETVRDQRKSSARRVFLLILNACLLDWIIAKARRSSEQDMYQDIETGIRQQKAGNHLHALRCGALAMASWAGLALFGPAVAASLSTASAILPAPTEAIVSGGSAGPTLAWAEFCQSQPQECAVDASEPMALRLEPDVWLTILEVNERVNRMILAVTDQDHWGVLDRWDYPDDGLGDCEDIQLLKRKLLIEAGLPRRALRMTVVLDEHGMGHAVLMVRTSHGDFALDNKRDSVLAWQETGYHYVKREGDDGSAWVWLGGQITPTVTATK
jgi:predicted transglutaminase-like cysteine proteinase